MNVIDIVEYKARVKFREDMKRTEDINKKIQEIKADREKLYQRLQVDIPKPKKATVVYLND